MLTSTDGVMWTERITGTFKSLNAAERPPAVLDRDGGTGEPRW